MNEKHLSPFIHLIGLFFLTLFVFLSAIACAEKPVQSLIEFRHANIVVQKYDLSCGAAALTSLLNFQYGENFQEKDVAIGLMHRNEYVEDPTLIQQREGFSLLDIKRYVDSIGYKGVGMAGLEINDLIKMAPIMVPINIYGYNHFVIFRGAAGNRVLLADPAWGNRTMLLSRFESAWINYSGIGKVGFVIKRASSTQHVNRLTPSLDDFPMLR